jgi:two-component system CheB/CheR fusion protein
VLPPAELAREIARIADSPTADIVGGRPAAGRRAGRGRRDENLQRIFAMLRGATGVDFRQYKMPTIERRLQRRLLLHKLTRLDEYVPLLAREPGESPGALRDILIHVTRFFREPESFRR